jgi:hypothetical protein
MEQHASWSWQLWAKKFPNIAPKLSAFTITATPVHLERNMDCKSQIKQFHTKPQLTSCAAVLASVADSFQTSSKSFAC